MPFGLRPLARPSRAAGVLVALLLAFAPRPAAAQETGTLQGMVRDEAGAPLAGVGVEVVQAGGARFRRGTRTDAAGRFILPRIPPRPLRLRVAHPGFAAEVLLQLAPGETRVQDLVARPRLVTIDT
ncbi:MAG TPA: carboxypeptidase-like regulatory domain-containing protein, partial [Longimicrobium sp.]|nr:carboxypeptidase-like regulatory domain-containing protein [Longimicrobium sp.]